MPADFFQALGAAIDGLLYESESDAPFQIVRWRHPASTLSSADLLSLTGRAPTTHVEQLAPDELFQDLTQDQDWHRAAEKKTVEKYRDLWALLGAQLTDLQVFEVGEVQIAIYIVGRTPIGDWAGVSTTAVET